MKFENPTSWVEREYTILLWHKLIAFSLACLISFFLSCWLSVPCYLCAPDINIQDNINCFSTNVFSTEKSIVENKLIYILLDPNWSNNKHLVSSFLLRQMRVSLIKPCWKKNGEKSTPKMLSKNNPVWLTNV